MNATPFTQRLLDNPLATVADFYAQHRGENAHDFLTKNCLSSDSMLRVGYSDRSLGKQIPDKQFKLGREIRTKLKQVGILKPNGRETLRGFITLPLTDIEGNVTGIYGERIDKKNKPEPRLTIGSGTFNASALTNFDEIILCESVLDAWTFYAAGHTNAVAIEGQQHQLLGASLRFPSSTKRVLLAGSSFDESHFNGTELMRIHFPEGTTVNDFAILSRTVDDALGKRIRAASVIDGGVGCQPAKQEDSTMKDTESSKEDTKQHPLASPTPTPIDDIDVAQSETEITLRIETRRYRVRGLDRNTTSGVMKTNLLVFNERNDRFHVDTLDLYHSRARRVYLKEASEETAISESELRGDLGRVLLKLEQLQDEQKAGGKAETKLVELSDTERAEAMELLQDTNLLDRILEDFDACGIVGERTGKLAGYLAATSRLLNRPLGLVIQSSSAAGKSSLAEAVLRFMPPEARFSCSAMTSQSLYYLGKENLKHKILSVAEEEGVRDASYQLKLLQSEGHLSLVATTKESGTGRTATERYEVQGPVALVMTTTALDVDPELMNRCLVVNVDESAEQTQAIHALQRHAHTLEGIQQAAERNRIETLHQNAQRCLRPLVVVNPYADQLKFIDNQARHRRDHIKYLTLIDAVAFLHQHQREVKRAEINGIETDYIEVTRRDIALANMIADWALGRSIDELAGPTRRLLIALYDWLRGEAEKQGLEISEVTFTRRQAREAIGWSATPLRIHLERLCLHEYAVPNGGGGHGKLRRYSLIYDGRGREGQPSLVGLIDPAKLNEPEPTTTTSKLTGQIAG